MLWLPKEIWWDMTKKNILKTKDDFADKNNDTKKISTYFEYWMIVYTCQVKTGNETINLSLQLA